MSMNEGKSSAELEQEVQQQRDRVEARIGEIKERLSPGQLLDEALSYTKDGGNQFVQNFGAQVTANPMPAALVGIGLAWLISSNVSGHGSHASHSAHADHSGSAPRRGYSPATSYTGDSTSGFQSNHEPHTHPYASVGSGGLRRVSHAADEAGQWWSEFESKTGDRYKAMSDEAGSRAGHFTDQTGRVFSGFIDETGNRVRDFRDNAGNMLSDAQGWANHNWSNMQNAVSGGIGAMGSAARNAASGMMSHGRDLGSTVQQQSDQLARTVVDLFDRQPLVAGALAFAAGAAIGATLPHTAQEDKLVGEPADQIRREAMKTAGNLYEQGKQQAGEIYRDLTDKAASAYDEVKDRVAAAAETNGVTNGAAPAARH